MDKITAFEEKEHKRMTLEKKLDNLILAAEARIGQKKAQMEQIHKEKADLMLKSNAYKKVREKLNITFKANQRLKQKANARNDLEAITVGNVMNNTIFQKLEKHTATVSKKMQLVQSTLATRVDNQKEFEEKLADLSLKLENLEGINSQLSNDIVNVKANGMISVRELEALIEIKMKRNNFHEEQEANVMHKLKHLIMKKKLKLAVLDELQKNSKINLEETNGENENIPTGSPNQFFSHPVDGDSTSERHAAIFNSQKNAK